MKKITLSRELIIDIIYQFCIIDIWKLRKIEKIFKNNECSFVNLKIFLDSLTDNQIELLLINLTK